MNITLVLTEILGILFTVIGISMAVNRKTACAALQEITRDQGVLWLWGIMALIIGAVFVSLNNLWTSGLPLVVTIVGWIALVKGIFILFFPRAAVSLYRKCAKENIMVLCGFVVLIIGLILLYQGFVY